jgi:hypothetical protein
MPSWKLKASAIALWLAAGCVPISSNFLMSFARAAAAGVSGQCDSIRSRRTYRNPVPIGASSHLCRLVP